MKHFWIRCGGACISVTLIALAGCGKDDPKAVNNPPVAPSITSGTIEPAPEKVMQAPAPSPAVPDAAKPTEVHPTTAPADMAAPSIQPPKSTGNVPPQDSRVAVFAGLTAPKPPTWIWHPTQRQFAAAEFAVPGRDGFDQARITVFRGIGGSPRMNIDRWQQTQFKSPEGGPVEPKVQEIVVDDMEVTLAEFVGDYKGTGAVSFSPNHTLLAALIPEAPAGSVIIYFVGPTGTVEPNREAFMEMIHGLRRVEPEK